MRPRMSPGAHSIAHLPPARVLARAPVSTLIRPTSVAQRKTAPVVSAINQPSSHLRTAPVQPPRQPVAPPVYRPQPTPKVLQRKMPLDRQQTHPASRPNNPGLTHAPHPAVNPARKGGIGGSLTAPKSVHRTSPDNSRGNSGSRFVAPGRPSAVSSVAQPRMNVSAVAKTVSVPRSVRPSSSPNQKHKTFPGNRRSAIQCSMDFDDKWKELEREKDRLREAVTAFLKQRPRQYALASPGVIACIVEVAIQEDDLEKAKNRAGEILSAVAQIEQHCPLAIEESDIQAIPQRLIENIQQSEHLLRAQEAIENCAFLTRRIAQIEADVFADRQRIGDPEFVFPNNVEGAKAFALDRAYRFGDSSRNQRTEDYAYMLRIRLTRTLKDYLIKHLWINVYKVNGKNYKSNPQIKYENKGYTVIIPKDAWRAFWQRVETFNIETAKGESYKSTKDLHDAMHKEWHLRQMTRFNQLGPMTETPSYIS